MSMIRLFAFAFILFAAFFFAAVLAQPAPSGPARKAVVVELFTSEGCSSCPPADELLGRLRQERAASGVEIIPLGFHVDYWNYLGWQDRFSSSAYSRRQDVYARRFHLEGPYTPQMVVDGAAEFVGNSASLAQRSIAQAAAQQEAAEIAISPATSGNVQVSVKAPANTSAEVFLAITEDNLSSQIKAGENNGRSLRHAAVVRDLRRLGEIKNGGFVALVPVAINKDWKPADLHIVVFAQEPGEGRILGAATLAAGSLSSSH